MPDTMTHQQIWTLSGPALLLYVAAAGIFLAVQSLNLRGSEGLAPAFKARKPYAPFAVFLLTALSNFIGAATLLMLSRSSHTPLRQSMLYAPVLLVCGRYLQLARAKDARLASVSGLLGSAAGIAAGAWVLLRAAITTEPIAKAVVSGEVQTASVGQVLSDPKNWAVSVQLLAFYAVSIAVFYGAHMALKLVYASASLSRGIKDGKPLAFGQAFLAALGMNFFGGVAFVYASQNAGVSPRLAMVGVPAFLIVESYTRTLRADEASRRANWCGLIGSVAGIAGAVYLLMRDAPLH